MSRLGPAAQVAAAQSEVRLLRPEDAGERALLAQVEEAWTRSGVRDLYSVVRAQAAVAARAVAPAQAAKRKLKKRKRKDRAWTVEELDRLAAFHNHARKLDPSANWARALAARFRGRSPQALRAKVAELRDAPGGAPRAHAMLRAGPRYLRDNDPRERGLLKQFTKAWLKAGALSGSEEESEETEESSSEEDDSGTGEGEVVVAPVPVPAFVFDWAAAKKGRQGVKMVLTAGQVAETKAGLRKAGGVLDAEQGEWDGLVAMIEGVAGAMPGEEDGPSQSSDSIESSSSKD